MKKLICVITAVLTVLVCFASCGRQGPDTADTAPVQSTVSGGVNEYETVTGTLPEKLFIDMNCKEAYKGVLEDFTSNNDVFEGSVFTLIYLDADSIPELVVSNGTYHGSAAHLYSFDGERAVDNGEYGAYGTFEYIPYKGMIKSGHTGTGVESVAYLKFENNTVTKLIGLVEAMRELKEDSPYDYYINDVQVPYSEYETALNEYLSADYVSVFGDNVYEGLPFSIESDYEEDNFEKASPPAAVKVSYPLTQEGIDEFYDG